MDDRRFGRFEEMRRLAEEIRRRSPELPAHLAELLKDWRLMTSNPRTLGAWLEQKSPWLSRRFLGVASNISEPFTAGMGLQVIRIDEGAIEVLMPGGWRNQGEDGQIHSGALIVLGEFAARVFWELHLDLRVSEMHVKRVQLRNLFRAKGPIRGVFRMGESERELVLHRLRSEGHVEVESMVSLYDEGGKLVAELETDWEFQRRPALVAGQGESSDVTK